MDTFRALSIASSPLTSKPQKPQLKPLIKANTLQRKRPSMQPMLVHQEPRTHERIYRLQDVKDHSLKSALAKFYTEDKAVCGRLNPVQNAYFQHFFVDVHKTFTARGSVIGQLLSAGVRDGIWEPDFCPVGIKKGFLEYLKKR